MNAIGARLEDRGAENIGGHQVGRALHALEAESEQPSHRFHDQRLGNAGHAFEQRVALREHGHEHFADYLVLAGNYASQLRARLAQQLLRGLEGCARRLRDLLQRILFVHSALLACSSCCSLPILILNAFSIVGLSLLRLDPMLRCGG